MKDLLIVIALGLACGGTLVWLLVGLMRLRQELRWYRVRRQIARDAAQRARLQRIIQASHGR